MNKNARDPIVVPVVEPLEIRRGNVFEHTPLDYYHCGEYPRFVRPVGTHGPNKRYATTADEILRAREKQS